MIIRENVPKQEPVKESSFLDKVSFEESSLLEGRIGDAIWNKFATKKDREEEAKARKQSRIAAEKSLKDFDKATSVKSKFKNFTKEEVDAALKDMDKAYKALTRWFLTLKQKVKFNDFSIDDGTTYEYGDVDNNYSFSEYMSDCKRRYDDPENNDLSDIDWNFTMDWTTPKDSNGKDVEDMKKTIQSEFVKFLKSNGCKVDDIYGGRTILGYDSSKFPNACISYTIKDDEFSIYIKFKEDITK